MASDISLTSKIKIKTNNIYHNSMSLLQDKRYHKLFIAHSKGIHIYDFNSQLFQDIKISTNTSGQITCLTKSDDLIFFAAGMKILGCGGNGRILFECETYLAIDTIDAIHVYGYQLWLVSANMVSQFLIGGSQLSNQQSRSTVPPSQAIQDINSQIYDIDTEKPFLVLLKNNSQLQIYDGKQNKILLSIDSPPTYGYTYPNIQNNNKLLIGTMSGQLLYVQADKKGFAVIWRLKNHSSGRINCIVQVRNGFILFRDQSMQMWNDNKELIGKSTINDRILSSIYLPHQETIFYATFTGTIVEMFNYQKMMKIAKERNETSEKNNLIKQIEELKKLKTQLKAQAALLCPQAMINVPTNINNIINLSLDYERLCCCLSIMSDKDLVKVMVRGTINLADGVDSLQFQGRQSEENVYLIKAEGKNNLLIHLYYSQQFNKNQKVLLTIFNDIEGKLIASKYLLELKHLYLHQKIESNLIDKDNFKSNSLIITGQFKYLLMNAWLNSIFSEFGSPSLDRESLNFCYQSILTKNKVYISYRDNFCQFYSQSPTPLLIIKKTIVYKCYQRNISLNYSTNSSIHGVKNLLFKLAPRICELQKIKKQYELLPGLKQLQSQKMSSDMKEMLMKSEDIKRIYTQRRRQHEQMQKQLVELVAGVEELGGRQMAFGRQQLRAMIDMKVQNILKLIQ